MNGYSQGLLKHVMNVGLQKEDRRVLTSNHMRRAKARATYSTWTSAASKHTALEGSSSGFW